MNNTLWRNDKTGDVYSVWLIAYDGNGKEYVVYQKQGVAKTNQSSFLVRHSENLLVGKCQLLPGKDKFNWFVDFKIQQGDAELASKDLPWCRPSTLWFDKFTPVEKDFC